MVQWSPGSHQAEDDQDDRQQVAHQQLEHDVEPVHGVPGGEGDGHGHGGGDPPGGEDADALAHGDNGGPDEQLGDGRQDGDQDEAEQQELALLEPGQHGGGPLDQDHADEAEDEVVGEPHQPGGDEVVDSTATTAPQPHHVSSLARGILSLKALLS